MAALQSKTTDGKNVTVIIPTYKRPGLAEKLVRQIKSLHKDLFQILVIQSTGNTSSAKNDGIKKARGDIIIFFDDDVEITKETIVSHISAYKDKKVVGVAGRVINDGDKIPKYTEVETGKTNFLGTKFDYKFWSTKKQKADFVYGCNMSFRKKALLKINGFDERFPKIFEEVDLSKRIKKLGTIIFEPKALVYHHKAASGGIRHEESQNKQKLIFEYYGRYLAKNILFPISLFSLLLRTRTALSFSLKTILNLWSGYLFSLLFYHPFIFILPIIIFLRLWKVPNFFIFTFTEEWHAASAWEQVKNFHAIWIGASQANINFYLGPGFIYLNYLLFLVNKGDIAILAYFAAFLGLMTVICLYVFVRNLINQRVALFASILYGCSTLFNYYDRRFWNPSFIPIISLFLLYCLIKIYTNPKWLIVVAALIGAALHFHLLLLLFLLPTLYVILKNFQKIKVKIILLSLVVFIGAIFPLIIFDLNHNFDNLLAPYKIIVEGKKTGLYSFGWDNVLSHINTFMSALGRLWFLKLNSSLQVIALETNTQKIPGNPFLTLISLTALVWFFLKYRGRGYMVFFIALILFILAFLTYPSYNPEYYLMAFLTLLTIVIAFWLNSLRKIFAYAILIIFVIANVATVITTTEDYGLTMKKRLIHKTMAVVYDRPFSLEATGSLPNPQYSYAGWRLLFKIYGRTPLKSNVDSVLGWIYPDEISEIPPDFHVIISENPITLQQKPFVSFKEGIYYSYIIKNE